MLGDTYPNLFLLGIAQKTHLHRAEKRANKPRTKGTDMGAEDEKLEGQEDKGAAADEQKEEKPDTSKPEDKKDTEDKGEDVKDKHGQPGINAEKYKRDIEAKDAKIAELEAQVAKAAETKEGREKLEKQIADLKAEQADERVAHKLELAGCRDMKAAKARLDDFGGDVSKLKTECPYLFEAEKRTGRAGGKPGGAPDAIDEKLDKAFGLK